MNCLACDGECEYMGALGSRHYYRCRQCGLDNSSTNPPIVEEDTSDAVEES